MRPYHPFLLLFFLCLQAPFGLLLGQEDALQKKLIKIYQLAAKNQLYFFSSNEKKSYVIVGSRFERVDSDFYMKKLRQVLPDEDSYPSLEATQKLIEIARLKNYKIYLKNDDYLYILDNENKVKKITESTLADYFPDAPKQNQAKEARGNDTVTIPFSKRQTPLKAIAPGLHYKDFSFAIKKVSIGPGYTYTSHVAYTPYYSFKFPLSTMLQIGVTPLRGTTSLIFTLDYYLFLIAHYPLGLWTPALYLGVGQQRWFGVSSNFTSLQYGLGVWSVPFFPFIDKVNIIFNSMKRSDGTISEIKLCLGLSF